MSSARERLLRTASALFYAEGVRAVGVDRVIGEAGVTRATFYRHFPGKQDLVVAYLTDTDALLRRLAGPVPDDGPGAVRWLRGVNTVLGEAMCAQGFRGCAFINAAVEYPDPASPVRVAVAAHRAWLEGAVRLAFTHAGTADPAAAARRWMVLRDGTMVGGYLGDGHRSRTALDEGVTDLLAGSPPGCRP